MALNLMVAVLDRGPDDLAEMAVLLAIVDSADKDTGEAWPSKATIARRSRQTYRNVLNVLERLRAGGWLTWEVRTRPNGSTTSNLYTVNLEQLGEVPRPKADKSGGGERRSSPPGNVVPPPREPASSHGGEAGSSPEPSHHLNLGEGADFPILGKFLRGELDAMRDFTFEGKVVDGLSPYAEAWRLWYRRRDEAEAARRVADRLGLLAQDAENGAG